MGSLINRVDKGGIGLLCRVVRGQHVPVFLLRVDRLFIVRGGVFQCLCRQGGCVRTGLFSTCWARFWLLLRRRDNLHMPHDTA